MYWSKREKAAAILRRFTLAVFVRGKIIGMDDMVEICSDRNSRNHSVSDHLSSEIVDWGAFVS